ncbi:LacI family DNA-binding transcriptional regulator [Dictyobacter kobayashii]|uniref:LacI family transcriptional regulator n=1 Tax=Dictyobacter kobayashii TaxID=2014872 RepID=A0A402AT87_9CHLR|nr:LacI family DNA-binding transcriptional regulator [Dictyobacter kobayashii]GCE22307.1 LacI family transcriptional regulator [Dictyobacter kobayashii]
MAGSITVKDIARQAEVSVGTVSRVFNNHSNVTEEIRERVLKAAATLGYARMVSENPQPRSEPRKLKEIGFLYCSYLDNIAATNNPFWSHILNGAENAARRSNIKVTYRAIGELTSNPQLLLESINKMELGGILLVGPAEAETIKHIKSLNIPLVLVDNHVPGLSVDSVLCDNYEGAKAAVDYLIAKGHRDIAFIGGPVENGPRPINKVFTVERRAAGYRTALLNAGIPINYDLFEASDLYPESAYEACKRLIARKPHFTALFGANDSTAIGAMKALREAGVRVPEDVSIIGFDDIDMVEHLTPALCTVRIDKEAMGSVAVRRLIARAEDPEMVTITSMLEVELIERDSVIPYQE